VFVGSNPTLSDALIGENAFGHFRQIDDTNVVARIGFSATNSRESRQGRKAAAAAVMSGAGGQADAGRLPSRGWGRDGAALNHHLTPHRD
jgi:hypothetical protein